MATPNTHFGKDRIKEMLRDCHSIHFIGVGGIMMSSLAILSARQGYAVSGSDRTLTALTDRVAAEGVRVTDRQCRENAADCDAAVYTVAISPDNPEYLCALERGISLISRADYLGYLMTGYRNRIGIAGMHGKSTCTSMCAQIFMDAGADPTVLSGAEMASMGGAYRIGAREHFIFEACEYEDSFLDFNPSVAVLLNAEMEHVDYFKSLAQIRNSFAAYASLVGENGYAVFNADDENLIAAMSQADGFRGKKITFGVQNTAADWRATDISVTDGHPSFTVLYRGAPFVRIRLSVCGTHNIYNALAAVAVSALCGIEKDAIANGLAAFCGAKRRMEYKGTCNGAAVYDDYGHHPTEVRTTLDGARALGYQRLFCVFQSHTYSRTAELYDRFLHAFDSADRVILTDIYAARETNTYGVTPQKLASDIGEKASYGGSLDQIAQTLRQELCPGDLCVIMGAGDVYRLFGMLGL